MPVGSKPPSEMNWKEHHRITAQQIAAKTSAIGRNSIKSKAAREKSLASLLATRSCGGSAAHQR